jgi:hypothetical protein
MMNRPVMTCTEVDGALLDYLEETLEPGSRERVDEHVAGCLRCSAIMRDLGAIRSGAAQLPELVPPRDLWEGIAGRIQPTVLPLGVASRRELPRRWIPAAAAAAAALVIVTAGITYFATSRSLAPSVGRVASAPEPRPTASATLPTVAAPRSEASVTAAIPTQTEAATTATETRPEARPVPRSGLLASRRSRTPASPGEVAYGDEIQRLQAIITQRRRQLDPATVAIIEQSLKVIDAAVKQSRAALARDPGSGFLADQLNHALEKKVELMRTVALLPSST